MKLEIDLDCPACHRKMKVAADEVRPGNSRRCSGCGETIRFQGDDLGKAQRALDDLERSLKNLGNMKIKL